MLEIVYKLRIIERKENLQNKKFEILCRKALSIASGQHDTANFIFISRDEKICFNQGRKGDMGSLLY